ncbi:hypothetical protein AGJ35_21665 [Cronobacter dublinensis subsp. dublinensis]|nr:hypothetical protein [Cronobacter dublinensis subsp. dublinensis]
MQENFSPVIPLPDIKLIPSDPLIAYLHRIIIIFHYIILILLYYLEKNAFIIRIQSFTINFVSGNNILVFIETIKRSFITIIINFFSHTYF